MHLTTLPSRFGNGDLGPGAYAYADCLARLPHAALREGGGRVNGIDLAYVLADWGTPTALADLNRDGFVGGEDLAIILSSWAP